MSANHSAAAVVKDANLKMYRVMSVKQSLREDLAEHLHQFSCRAADWSRMSFSHVPMQLEPLELHVADALGQQNVPDLANECWDAHLFGDRDTDLGGNEIFMRPPKILVETEVASLGVVWKIKGLRTHLLRGRPSVTIHSRI